MRHCYAALPDLEMFGHFGPSGYPSGHPKNTGEQKPLSNRGFDRLAILLRDKGKCPRRLAFRAKPTTCLRFVCHHPTDRSHGPRRVVNSEVNSAIEVNRVCRHRHSFVEIPFHPFSERASVERCVASATCRCDMLCSCSRFATKNRTFLLFFRETTTYCRLAR